jgi:HSP20 family protein
MAELLPHNLKHALTRLREDVPVTFDRWLRRLAVDTDVEREGPARRSALAQLRENIHHALNRWLQRLKRRSFDSEDNRRRLPSFFRDGDPSIKLEETDDEIVVLAEMPGLEPGDFKVEATDDRLILRGQKEVESEERDQRYYYAERLFGAFTRAIPLPCQVDVSRASATYRNGLLRIVLPKAEHAKANRVRVRVA